MRVSIICNDIGYFLRHRRSVADALVARGDEVDVLAGGECPTTAERDWAFGKIDMERFAFSPWKDMRLFLKAFRHFMSRKPDAVCLITLKPAVFAGAAALMARALSGRQLRMLVIIPGLGRLMGTNSAMVARRHQFARRAVRGVIRWLSGHRDVYFVFETEADRNSWLRDGMVRVGNSEAISGAGVDETVFFPAPERNRATLRVLFASRLLRSKGLDVFLNVARRFENDPRLEFVVAGMSDPTDSDCFQASDLAVEKAILFLGECDDMPELLRSVDIVCLPTRYGEGIPRILIEAAACGVPGIASDLDGCRSVVVDGATGFVIPHDRDLAEAPLIAALQKYLETPGLAQRHGEAARENFSEGGFSERNIVARYLELVDFQ